MTDPASGGVGAFVDDTHVVVDGGRPPRTASRARRATGPSAGPPAGSPPNQGNWQIAEKLVDRLAGTSTEDTLLLGFGLEQLSSDAQRVDLLQRAFGGLLD